MKSVQFFPLILWYFMFGSKFWFFEKNGSILDRSENVSTIFFGQITSKKLFSCSWEITKKSLRQKGLKIFIFWPYGFENLGFLTNAAWVRWGQKLNGSSTGTKTDDLDRKKSNLGKSVVPLGCRAILGSVLELIILKITIYTNWSHSKW